MIRGLCINPYDLHLANLRKTRQLSNMTPLLETVLSRVTSSDSQSRGVATPMDQGLLTEPRDAG
jgi:hypothetical protein